MIGTEPADIMRFLDNWGDIIEQLLAGETSVQELGLYLDRPPRTIRRALATLADHGLVVREHNAFRLTQFGRHVAWTFCGYRQQLRDVTDAAELLACLSFEAPIGCELMDGVAVERYPETVPDVAFDEVEISMEGADRVCGIAPEARQRYVEVFAGHVFRQRTDVELILDQETITNLDEYYTSQWRGALNHPNCTIWQTDTVPAFGLIIVDQSDVWVGVYQDGGGLIGTLHNDSMAAVEWALALYERYRENAEHVTPATNGDAP